MRETSLNIVTDTDKQGVTLSKFNMMHDVSA